MTTSDIEVRHNPVSQLVIHAQNMSAAKQLADALCATDMVPAQYKGKPANGAAAILYGEEIGLNPIQSLQNIFIVQGKPAIYARTAVALVRRHGVKVKTVATSDESVTVSAEREGQLEESTWDIARATAAGYLSNAKYKSNPQEMLYSKAAMEVCRKIAPDVLLGIAYSGEELELETPVRVESSRVSVEDIVKPTIVTVEPAESALFDVADDDAALDAAQEAEAGA
jgi:hypothetical protein